MEDAVSLTPWAVGRKQLDRSKTAQRRRVRFFETSRDSSKACSVHVLDHCSWLLDMLAGSNRHDRPPRWFWGLRRTILPFVNVGVNVMFFYFLSPVFILMAYAYFHLSLQGVWESAANLPIYFPDGLRVDQKLHPWPLLRISELIFPWLRKNASRFSILRVRVTKLLFLVRCSDEYGRLLASLHSRPRSVGFVGACSPFTSRYCNRYVLYVAPYAYS